MKLGLVDGFSFFWNFEVQNLREKPPYTLPYYAHPVGASATQHDPEFQQKYFFEDGE